MTKPTISGPSIAFHESTITEALVKTKALLCAAIALAQQAEDHAQEQVLLIAMAFLDDVDVARATIHGGAL